ncbi:MAG: pyridoxamine 5'-phosphate oxidase family protein [Methanopyri archaeon]|nr:pyridoxamine 5'-phosphate oxidase family protein [Methanopyri archaeon]
MRSPSEDIADDERTLALVEGLLSEERIGYICTGDRNNAPHITPVFFAYIPHLNEILFVTDRASKKIRNIIDNPHVSFTVDVRHLEDPFKNEGVMINGTAMISDVIKDVDDLPGTLRGPYRTYIERFDRIVKRGKGMDRSILVRIVMAKAAYWMGADFRSFTFENSLFYGDLA